MAGRIVVGTSSWADPGFVEEWNPPDLAARDRLAYYAERFEAVEVNSTFYAVPATSTVARWVRETPAGFTFDVKLHRLLSRHSAGCSSLPKDMREAARTTPRGRVKLTSAMEVELADHVLEAIEPLIEANRLSSFLLQLSPAFGPRDHGLDELLPLLERLAPHPVAVELRHAGWTRDKRIQGTLDWFDAHDAVWVATDMPHGDHMTIMPPVDAVTDSRLAYFRAHGRNLEGYVRGRSVAERFGYRYRDSELEEIAGRARELAARAEEVRVAFNNNRGSDAPVAAARFREIVG
jgi:uncharacterized protein YecE (DUF72 family)